VAGAASANPADRRNRRTALLAGLFALAMLGLGYASAPLYRLFCQVTGLGGTTQRVSEAEAAGVQAAAGGIRMRFDANVERGMPWKFKPGRPSEDIQLGGRRMTFYTAENLTDQPITGRATFNVTPEQAGRYFNKIECFCFTEQTLQPGQVVHIEEITLSYTFHKFTGNKIAEP
jgi:cytochrome c oxidase assembly protein subunit 11